MKTQVFFLSLALALSATPRTWGQQPASSFSAQGNFEFSKRPNVFITMRDGIHLATDLYIPKGNPGDRFPVVLIRTPYGNFPGNYLERSITVFASHGFAVAVQDKRGKYRSEGTYLVSGGDAEDGYDTIDWLSKQSWSNGRIGTYGCSYLGDIQIFAAQTKHPALKAMIPQASGSSAGSIGGLYRYFGERIGGVNEWAATIGWFAKNGAKIAPRLPATLGEREYTALYAPYNQAPKEPVIDYQRAWRHLPMVDALRDQGFPDSDFVDNIERQELDPYWKQLPYMTDAYTSNVPALFVNSWYDFGADITFFEYDWFRQHSITAEARDNQYVIISPGTHCSSEREAREDAVVGTRPMGDTRFEYWQTYLAWFDYWLKGDSKARETIDAWPRFRYFLMGDNKWQSSESWPPKGSHEIRLLMGSNGHANSLLGDGVLSFSEAGAGAAFDSFVYDPDNPVPSLGGAMCCTGTADAMPGAQDQRPVEERNDVLVYTSETLKSGIEVTGPVEVTLFVSSTAIDTDFTAKLVDVYPDGRAFNILESIRRARYRDGFERAVWMRSDRVYELRIPIGVTSNYFPPGHRIRLEVSSSNFPRFDRNLNVGGDNATATTWVVAKNRVFHSSKYPSGLKLMQRPR
jgi:putative CocE/NonD family hydrolase